MEKYEKLRKVFENNNFGFVLLEKKEDVVPYLKEHMEKESVCSVGGSVTLDQCRVLDLLRCGDYEFLDRYEMGADLKKIFRATFSADYYISSANALTEHGEVYLVDGTGNRVSATIYGPDKVYLVCGVNKIVKNLKEAVERVKTVAAPLNAKRLNYGTYCRESGQCAKNMADEEHLMCSFTCQNTICCSSVALSRQKIKDRIVIILVAEELGY